MKAGNFENNLHYIPNNVGIGNLNLLSSCLYANIDNTQEYPTIKLVLAITNYKNKFNNKNINFLTLIH